MIQRNARIGLICIGLDGERLDLAEKFFAAAKSSIKNRGMELAHPDAAISLTADDVLAEAKRIRDLDGDFIIYLVGTWISAPYIIDAVMCVGLPVGIWGIPEPASFSSVGANVLHGAMDEMDLKHQLFYGEPDEADTLQEIKSFADAAKAVKQLRCSRLGLIGGRSLGAYPTTADPNQIKKIFGIEVEHIDQLVLLEKARSVHDDISAELIPKIKAKLGKVNVSDEALIRPLKTYIALKQIVEERKLDFLSVKCLEEFINTYTTCCLANSMLNDEGIITGCQGNINAAVSMKILHIITGMPAVMADVNVVLKKEKIARMVNCGSMPTSLAAKNIDVDLSYQYDYMGDSKGVCTTFCCKSGPVTFATLGRKNGKYVMHIAEGEAFEQPKEEFAVCRDVWPHAFVKLNCDMMKFYSDIRSNHSVIGYGNIKNTLVTFCELLDITAIVNN
ncbi:MAG: hypothetical protein PHO15_00205 [Eubacteriales bacterium]|nr:hypothetical protein [Eubacteriales bacterium]